MERKDEYKEKMEGQLKEWGSQIDLLEEKMKNTKADIRAEEIKNLRAKWNAASEKLDELEASSGEAWGQVKKTADMVWEDIKTGMARVHEKFK